MQQIVYRFGEIVSKVGLYLDALMFCAGEPRMRHFAGALGVGRVATVGFAVAVLACAPASAVPPGSQMATEALAICEAAEHQTGDQRKESLERGLDLAEQAVEIDERDGRAHFALVCNLGKKMELAGIGLSQLVNLRRVRRSADAALAAAPDDADALAAKGALLLRLPRFFGGDRAEAEELLRRAVKAEPQNGTARCYLAQALTARGADDEARALQAHC
jgi:Flp pilus assembly protein TadD